MYSHIRKFNKRNNIQWGRSMMLFYQVWCMKSNEVFFIYFFSLTALFWHFFFHFDLFILQVLLTALRFNNKAVAQIASDMVLLLSDHVEKLLDFYPEVPKKIVEVLARTLTSLIPQVTHDLENDERRLLLSLLFCLGECNVFEIVPS